MDMVDWKCMHMNMGYWNCTCLSMWYSICSHVTMVISSASAHVVASTDEGARGAAWILMLGLDAAVKSKTGEVASTVGAPAGPFLCQPPTTPSHSLSSIPYIFLKELPFRIYTTRISSPPKICQVACNWKHHLMMMVSLNLAGFNVETV